MKHLKKVLEIFKKKILDKKKKMHIWKKEDRILEIHSKKETSEDRSKKDRNSKQMAGVTKSKRG
jgi:hypothetical protein